MESQYIKDLEGNSIEVTDLSGAIAETEKFVGFSEEGSDLHKHWSYILQELNKLKPIPKVEVKKINKSKDSLSDIVLEVRRTFKTNDRQSKGFIKDGRTSPVYGIKSCAKNDTILMEIDSLKVGESVNNSTPRKITRVW